jgi:hypothetical protein
MLQELDVINPDGQLEQLLQIRSLDSLGAKLWKVTLSRQTVRLLHFLSVVSVGRENSYSLDEQTVSAVHFRSLDDVATILSYSRDEQTVRF